MPQHDSQFDTFISYATEDQLFAAQIVGALMARGVRVWFAPLETKVGDKLVDSVEQGMRASAYSILLISKAYLTKRWTNFEKSHLLKMMIEGRNKVLQIWHDVDKAAVEAIDSTLPDLLSISSNVGFPNLIEKLLRVIRPGIAHNFEIKAGVGFNYHNFLDSETRDFIIIGQNIRGLFRQEAKFLDDIREHLIDKPTFRATVILTTQEFFTSISGSKNPDRELQAQFAETVFALKKFHAKLTKRMQQRFCVRFHPGASSLTAFIRDPEHEWRGAIAFIPKWATEITPGARAYCIVERSHHDALFQSLYGYVPEMYDKTLSTDLDDMYSRVQVKCTELQIKWPPQ